MSDLQITQLTSLPEAGIQSADVAAVADISASETKKVTIKDFVAAGITLIDDASIPGAKIGVLSSNQVNTGAIIDSAVTNAKLANSSITLGGVSISLGSNDASPAFNLADATGYPTSSLSGTITNAQLAGSITGAKISDSTITYAKLNISDGDIPGAKITGASITAGQLASDSVTAAKIAENAVGASEIGSAVITSSHVAANTLTADNLAPNCIGTSELSSSSVETSAIQDNAITTAKILNANVTAGKLAANLPGTILATGAIGSTQLAENSVTASELANNSVDTNAIANSAVTDGKIASGIAGTKITDGTITPAKLNTSNLDRSLNVDGGNLGINNVIDAGTVSGISYNAQGLITGVVALATSDIPIATTSAVGGVSVGTGLSVDGAGALSLSNSVTAANGATKVNYDAQGQITGSSALAATDLPIATTSAVGAVQITASGGLTVDGSGGLTLSASGVSSGTYQSVVVNTKGVVTSGSTLTAGQVPPLAASKITSGTFDATRIAAGSIDGTRLSNNSTTVFQSVAQSGFPEPQFSGQMLFDTVEEDAYIYDGTAWQAITTLTKGSLTFGGTYDADQQKVVSVTVAGAAANLTANADLPVASAQTDGVYVVVEKQGTPSGGNAPQQLLVPPDYILGVTASGASSWREVDLSSTVSQQTASNITFSAGGDIVASTVQAAIEEVDTEKLAKAGGTITGQLLIGHTGSLVFEGSSNDDFETTIAVANPTDNDKTITLPNRTGTVITSGDDGTVTGTIIADGTIENVNIKSDAAIALSKLVTVTSGNFLIGAATSGTITSVGITGDISIDNNGLAAIAAESIVNADINANAAIAGSKIVAGTTSVIGVVQLENSATSTSTTKAATPASVKVAKDAADTAQSTANAALPKTGGTLTGNLILDDANELRLNEPTVENETKHHTGLKAQAQSGDITLTLPAVAPTPGQVLKADASTPTTLTWASDSATDSSKLPLTGGTMQGAINLNSNNITNGGTITGTFVGSVTGNADTATKFVSTVNINNEAFDGSADITVTAAAGTLTGTELKNTVVTSSLTSVGTLTSLNVSGTITGDVTGALTGNADTATALATARTLGGVSFDGTANIDLPGVNTAGTVDTTGKAATATKLASSVTIGGVAFDGSANIDLPGVNTAGDQNTTGIADKATNIAVADESTDTTCFPLFSTDATGTAVAAKSSASKLTFNSNTGALTATSFAGNGANLTNLPSSGGSVQIEADGSISSNDAVIITSDGKAKTISTVAESNGSISTFTTGDSNDWIANNTDVTWDASESVAIVLWTIDSTTNSNRNRGYISVGTVSGTTISWNATPVAVSNWTAGAAECFIESDGEGGGIVVMGGKYKRFTVSGTTLTLDSSEGNFNATQKTAFAYLGKDGGSHYYVFANNNVLRIIKWDGQNLTTGNQFTTPGSGSAGNSNIEPHITPMSHNRFIGYGKYVCTRIGTNCIIGPEHSSTELGAYLMANHHFGSAYDHVNSKFIMWRMPVNNDDDPFDEGVNTNDNHGGKVIVCDIDGDRISKRFASEFVSTGVSREHYYYYPTVAVTSKGQVVVTYSDFTNSYGKQVIGTYNDGKNGMTWSSPTALNSEYTRSRAVTNIADGKLLYTYNVGDANTEGSSAMGKSFVLQAASTTLTSDNFLGFSSGGYSDEDTATINTLGNTMTSSGLEASKTYYVQDNGTLATTKGSFNVVAGKALSATKLLITPV